MNADDVTVIHVTVVTGEMDFTALHNHNVFFAAVAKRFSHAY